MNAENIIANLTETLKGITDGAFSIALSGSRCKNMSDDDSDIDLYILVDDLKPYDDIYDIVTKVSDSGAPIYLLTDTEATPFGGAIDFRCNGIPIEVTVKKFSKVKQQLDNCIDGKFDIVPQTWTSNGYYTFICLSEINYLKPLWESDNFIKNYKEKIECYPEKLRNSIISVFWGRANTWINNFHYESAISRGDYLFTSPIVLHTVLDMVQIIFALNKVYFTGDKRLESTLRSMPYCPISLLENLPFLLQASDDKDRLQSQYDILKNVVKELGARIENEN